MAEAFKALSREEPIEAFEGKLFKGLQGFSVVKVKGPLKTLEGQPLKGLRIVKGTLKRLRASQLKAFKAFGSLNAL